MTTIAELGSVLQELLTTTADEVGRQSGFIQRQRKLRGSSYAQALVFGWMSNPASTMSELSQAAATVGVRISKQGLDARFSPQSAAFMEALLQRAISRMIEGETVQTGLFTKFKEVHVQDSTSIRLPEALWESWRGCNATGNGRAGLKISVDWELVRGRITGLQLQAAREHDQQASLAHQAGVAMSLYLRDLGYFNLKQFARQAQAGSYFLSRLKASCQLFDADGQAIDGVRFLQHCPHDYVDKPVLVGAAHVPCRLLAWRVPPAVANQRRQHLQANAADQTRPVSQRRWHTADWSIYITNVPVDALALAQAQVLVKVRWQIELLFKRWKSDGLLDEWRTADPWRALTECLAKLLALLIQHWCILLGAWQLPNRSLHQAIQLLRKHAFHLAAALSAPDRLGQALASIQQALPTCLMSSLRKRPHTFQLLLRGTLA